MTDRFVTVPDTLELPAAVKVPSANLTDSGTAGRAVVAAETAADGRTALGLGGSSTLAVGTTAGTVKAGDWKPAAADVTDSTAAGRALLTAATVAAQQSALGIPGSPDDIGAATAAQGALADATVVQQVTLTASLVYTLPAGIPANTVHRVTFTQDGTGGHTVTYGGAPVTVDLTAGASTLVEIWPGGTLVYPGESGVAVESVDGQTGAVSLSSTYVHVVTDLVADDATDNRAVIQAAVNTGGTVILPPTTGRYCVAGTIDITVPGTVIRAHGAPVRQATPGLTLLNVKAPDVTIDGLDVTGATGQPDFTGMTAAWEGSIIASRWTAINVYAAAHRLYVPWIRGSGMSSVVRISGWDHLTNSIAAYRVDDIEIGTILCARAEFGIAAKGTSRLRLGSVRGTYGDTASRPRAPHLIYLAEGGQGHTNMSVGSGQASVGVGGHAFQFKGIAAGQIGLLQASACEGVLSVMGCSDLDITELLSTGDTYSDATGVTGSLLTQSATTGLRIGKATIKLVNDSAAVALLAAGTGNAIGDLRVEVDHTTTGAADAYDVQIRGTGTRIDRVEITNLSATNAWNALGVWTTLGVTVGDLRAFNVRTGVALRDSDARVKYDPGNITLHPVDGYARFTSQGNGGRVLSYELASLLGNSRLLVADTFEMPTTSVRLLRATITGQPWTAIAGQWRSDAAGGGYEAQNVASSVCVAESGHPDVDVSCVMKHGGTNGVALRVVDASNFLAVRLRPSSTEILTRIGGTATVVGTVANPHTVGRVYALRVVAYGKTITVYEDGVSVLTYTLSDADHAILTGTRHGVYANSTTDARFLSLAVNRLT